MSRMLRMALLLVLLAALLVGFAVPTLAAPPVQAPPTDAVALVQAVTALLDLLIALAIGGGIAYLLQMFKAWQNFSSPLKPLIVLGLTALCGGAFSALKVVVTAEMFAAIPEWARAFVAFVVIFVGSQLTYQHGFSQQWPRGK